MLQCYPASAEDALEFGKIKQLLSAHCRSEIAKARVKQLKPYSKLEAIEKALFQVEEFKNILQSANHFPLDFTQNAEKEIQLLQLEGARLSGQQLRCIRDLANCMGSILKWQKQNLNLYLYINTLTDKIIFEQKIVDVIEKVIDENGQVKDQASKNLIQIRLELIDQRNQLRKTFETILRKYAKQGYLADIAEGYINNRRTLAILAEHKRIIKGIWHGESESQRIIFIEPEETISLNNEIAALERAEYKEIQKILLDCTNDIAPYQNQLHHYYQCIGLLEFIRAKALLAIELQAHKPILNPHPSLHLVNAYHPLLWLSHQQKQKKIVPTQVSLDKNTRILIISGPNAGGKTVSMKTIGLLQMMLQSGLLVSASPQSEFGIFKQLMIHIGDTQSMEHELSTYSAHLRDMKYFMDFANGKTLFFIDELGSGSDPNLGGAFAEAIVEELLRKNAYGVITTHYLNLKVMASKNKGIVNAAMNFDEEHMEPLYQLVIGKPGSSYTFAIAQRSGLSPHIIQRAKALTDRGHFKLDKMLLQTEQQEIQLQHKVDELNQLLKENYQLKKEWEHLSNKERWRQQQETLKLQNEIKKEELEYLREMERNFKQIIIDWKKSENKAEILKQAELVLFKKRQVQINQSAANKTNKAYETIGGTAKVGDLVRNKINHQVGVLSEIKDKYALVTIGKLPFKVSLQDWIVVQKRNKEKVSKKH